MYTEYNYRRRGRPANLHKLIFSEDSCNKEKWEKKEYVGLLYQFGGLPITPPNIKRFIEEKQINEYEWYCTIRKKRNRSNENHILFLKDSKLYEISFEEVFPDGWEIDNNKKLSIAKKLKESGKLFYDIISFIIL